MGFVYLIKCEGSPYVKIGRSSGDPAKTRLSGLQTGNPFDLTLLWKEQVDDPAAVETRLHEHFGSKHHKLEWFDLGENPVSAFRDAFAYYYRKPEAETARELLKRIGSEDAQLEAEMMLRKIEKFTPGQKRAFAYVVREIRRKSGS